MKLDVKTAIAATLFAIAIGLLGWRAILAFPGEVARERDVCRVLRPARGFEVGPALPFSLKDHQGRTISLADYRGRVVFLNFWATWCPPCRDEMDSLEKLAGAFEKRNDFAMVAVSEDKGWDDVRTFLRAGSKHMTILMDDDWRVAKSYGTSKLPETYLVDKQGRIRHYIINKREWYTPQAIACIESLLDDT